MFTRQHYKAIAEILNKIRKTHKYAYGEETVLDIAGSLCEYFYKDNPRFNQEKFLEAVNFYKNANE